MYEIAENKMADRKWLNRRHHTEFHIECMGFNNILTKSNVNTLID